MRHLAFAVLALALGGCAASSGGASNAAANGIAVNMQSDSIYNDHFNAGAAALDDKLWALAVIEETKAIQRGPHLYPAYIDRGIAYAEEGNYQAAIADQTQAIAAAGKYGSGSFVDTLSDDFTYTPPAHAGHHISRLCEQGRCLCEDRARRACDCRLQHSHRPQTVFLQPL